MKKFLLFAISILVIGTFYNLSFGATHYYDEGVSDTAYDASSWDGDTGTAASKNALRDKIETLGSGDGNVTGPSTHADGYAPLWGTANSTSMLGGYLISAIGKLIAGDGNATAVRTTIGAYGSGDAPVFATVNTGPGATEVHKMDQDLQSTDDVEFLSVNATTIRGVQTANPQIACTDKNCTDGDTSFLIDVNATETGSGAEDVQVKIRAQRNGTMTTFIDIDAENDKIELFSSTSEVSGTVPFMGLLHKTWSFDPKTVCDGAVDRLFLMTVGDEAPDGLIIDEWKVSFEANPATEAVFNLKYANAFIGVASPVVVDVLNTAVGVSSEDTDANINTDGSAIPNGKAMYLEFGTPYTETTHQIIFEMWYHPL